ncbi:hypothetical protein C8R45DRAFT_947867 [Mycena sanguinolenta]|nr:hypothetical protein C8R45DRAFT_947867 [Mycena sanguinolenta]
MEHPWTPAQDKALKLEALRCADKSAPVSAKLDVWLGYYGAPTLVARNPTNRALKHAELLARVAARKVRRDTLEDLRVRALKATTHKWPRPRCHPHHPENQERRDKERREEQERRAVGRAQEQAAVKARVAHLMKLRAGMKGRRVSVTDLISLLRLSRSVNVALRYLLYRTVAVGASAGKFLDSLAANAHLRHLVRFLVFEDRCAQVRPRLWAALLPTLVNLVGLTIAYDMPLPHRVIPEIAFRLTFFESLSYLGCMWAQLLTLQPGLEELILHDVIWGCIPDPQFLPRLRRLRGYPADIAKFTKFLTLEDVWFISKKPLSNGKPTLRSRSLPDFAVSPCRFSTLRISAPDFVRLSTAAPDVVSMLQHLVLDEDLTWSEFLLKSDVYGLGASTFGRAATALDRNFAHLRSVLVECLQSTQNRHYRPLLERIHSRCFAKILAGHCSAPVLEAFRFHAADGFAVWTGWGKESEQVQYWDENDTEITLLEPEYSPLF